MNWQDGVWEEYARRKRTSRGRKFLSISEQTTKRHCRNLRPNHVIENLRQHIAMLTSMTNILVYHAFWAHVVGRAKLAWNPLGPSASRPSNIHGTKGYTWYQQYSLNWLHKNTPQSQIAQDSSIETKRAKPDRVSYILSESLNYTEASMCSASAWWKTGHICEYIWSCIYEFLYI